MSEELLRPDQFMIGWPCFVILSASGDGAVIQPLTQLNLPEIALLIFTDEDLVERHREEFKNKGQALALRNREEFLGYLLTTPDAVTHLLIDPSAGQPKLFPKQRIIEKLSSELALGAIAMAGTCQKCNGTGKCPECHGSGKDLGDTSTPPPAGVMPDYPTCHVCDGSGKCSCQK